MIEEKIKIDKYIVFIIYTLARLRELE